MEWINVIVELVKNPPIEVTKATLELGQSVLVCVTSSVVTYAHSLLALLGG